MPWAKRGQVTVALGGDIAKEAGILPRAAATGPVAEIATVVRSAPPPPAPAPVASAPSKLRIPSLGAQSRIQLLGVDREGAMESPDGLDDVGWYTFSAVPGSGGNAIFSGHRDWRTGVTGVFWGLDALRPGQTTEVGVGGRVLVKAVTESNLCRPNGAPIAEIVGQTAGDVITLITCDGTFSRNSRDYSHRRVVRAALVAIR